MSDKQCFLASIIIVLFILPFLFLLPNLYPTLNYYFSDLSDKLSVFQTYYTFIGAIAVVAGFFKYIVNVNYRIEPALIINNKSDYVEVQVSETNNETSMRFCIFNNGSKPILSDDISLNLNIDEGIDVNFTDGIINDNGDVVIPRISPRMKNSKVYKRIGSLIKTKIFSKRQVEIFKANFTFPHKGEYIFTYYFTSDAGFFPVSKPIEDGEPKDLGEIRIKVV